LPPGVFVLVFWYIDEKCQLIQSGISFFRALEMISEDGQPLGFKYPYKASGCQEKKISLNEKIIVSSSVLLTNGLADCWQ
jgi:hypothetical protein